MSKFRSSFAGFLVLVFIAIAIFIAALRHSSSAGGHLFWPIVPVVLSLILIVSICVKMWIVCTLADVEGKCLRAMLSNVVVMGDKESITRGVVADLFYHTRKYPSTSRPLYQALPKELAKSLEAMVVADLNKAAVVYNGWLERPPPKGDIEKYRRHTNGLIEEASSVLAALIDERQPSSS